MNGTIKKTYNSYRIVHGYIMSWEKSDSLIQGHQVTVLDQDENSITFPWRNVTLPRAGHRLSLVMVEEGASLRPDNPILILNHDTGDVFREPNAPNPRGTKPILLALCIWMMFAIGISGFLLYFAHSLAWNVILLLSAAFMIWRIAITTSELRSDERAMKRLQDEEKMCLEVVTSAWRLAAGQVFELSRKKSQEHSDETGTAL